MVGFAFIAIIAFCAFIAYLDTTLRPYLTYAALGILAINIIGNF